MSIEEFKHTYGNIRNVTVSPFPLNDLPKCHFCGNLVWSFNGYSLSNHSVYLFSCSGCTAKSVYAHNGLGPNVLLMSENGTLEEIDKYVNTTMSIMFRFYSNLLKEIRDLLVDNNARRLCTIYGLPFKTVDYKDVPDHLKEKWRDETRAICNCPDYKTPAGFDELKNRSPIPPQLPDGSIAFVLQLGKDWERVDIKESKALAIPPDPLRISHELYFGEVFLAVSAATRGTKIATEEVDNEYWPNETYCMPWYRFVIGKFVFKVGPRKRVATIIIKPRFPDLGLRFNVSMLRELATRDNVTYDVDGRYTPSSDTASQVEIHAWTKDKLIEYLTTAVKASLDNIDSPITKAVEL